MKTMKKNVKIRVLSLIIASAALGVALTVAAVMGSPYETLKKAALDAITYRNATIESQLTIKFNGEIYEEQKSYYVNGDDSSLYYYFDGDGNPSNFTYSSNILNINRAYTEEDGTQWYSAHGRPSFYNSYSYPVYNGGPFAVISPEDRDSARMRFMEMAADALIGNLKNNITMSTSGGVSYIQGTLTESQVPEIVKAGLDVLVEQSGGWNYSERVISFDGSEYVYESIQINNGIKNVTVYKHTVAPVKFNEDETWEFDGQYGFTCIGGDYYVNTALQEVIDDYTAPASIEDYDRENDPFNLPMESVTLNYLHGEAEVDANGALTYISFSATATVVTIFGDSEVVEISGSARFTDIGTSAAVCPIPEAEQLLNNNYITNNFGSNFYGAIYFKLNEDGGIDPSSVTTTFPGELDNRYNGYWD